MLLCLLDVMVHGGADWANWPIYVTSPSMTTGQAASTQLPLLLYIIIFFVEVGQDVFTR